MLKILTCDDKIPKIIHYCWFGKGEKSELAINCINSWKRIMPDYEIIEWNEENYNVESSCEFVKSAYSEKAYAFVSDFARFDIIEKWGGFYLDVDVEVLKDFEGLRQNGCLMGFQDNKTVAPGLIIGALPHHHLMQEMIQYYKDNVKFYDEDGKISRIPIGVHTNKVLSPYGLKANGETQKFDDFVIYAKDYFSPIDCRTLVKKITENTYTIHYYQGSWLKPEELKQLKKEKWIRAQTGDNILSAVLIYIYRGLGKIQRIKNVITNLK